MRIVDSSMPSIVLGHHCLLQYRITFLDSFYYTLNMEDGYDDDDEDDDYVIIIMLLKLCLFIIIISAR